MVIAARFGTTARPEGDEGRHLVPELDKPTRSTVIES